jgi:predicted ArsR family transcriptional regulator
MVEDFAGQVSRVAALAEPVRRDLYDFVVAQPEAVSRDQAAEALHVARHTAKFHLDRLVEEGLLDVEFRRLTGRSGPGAGRPTKLYRRSSREVAVTVPERHYDLAAQLMAVAIEGASSGGDVVASLHRAAADRGAAVAGDVRAAVGARAGAREKVDAVLTALGAQGYQPRVEGSTIVLVNCPFHTLAREHTELVCGMNLALLAKTAEGSDASVTARLDPAPGRCCVVLDLPARRR